MHNKSKFPSNTATIHICRGRDSPNSDKVHVTKTQDVEISKNVERMELQLINARQETRGIVVLKTALSLLVSSTPQYIVVQKRLSFLSGIDGWRHVLPFSKIMFDAMRLRF
ncbi:hypothetical protein TIFTF001_011144 [Ficus carica]|uniref:Uncharacterized protein n=1 Tax=Ficus carica TaxID=3494 RepID=A0AA87ZXQ8_FICCA|nr:hypothetical protein TIFTF001_011144 [Ficus carica]